MNIGGCINNITYQTEQLAKYFTQHRIEWNQFYDSERVVIEQLALQPQHKVLDIGCGCGGLGLAIAEKFGLKNYTGVEINLEAAQAARLMNPNAHIFCGDVLHVSQNELRGQLFDVVFSLSCVDWNIQFADMLAVAWKHVLPGGYLVATFRLTDKEGCGDFEQSYQYINYDGVLEGERAAYVVFNANKLLDELACFNPLQINAYGYWGAPSVTAVTPYQKLCFAAFSICKREIDDLGELRFNLNLPTEILAALRLSL